MAACEDADGCLPKALLHPSRLTRVLKPLPRGGPGFTPGSIPVGNLLARLPEQFRRDDVVQQELTRLLYERTEQSVFQAFNRTPVVFWPCSATSGAFSQGREVPVVHAAALTEHHVKQLRDHLQARMACPTFEDGSFLSLASSMVCDNLMESASAVSWRQYIQPYGFFYRGERGALHGVRVVEVGNTRFMGANSRSGSAQSDFLIFGPDPLLMVDLETPELRAEWWGHAGEVGWGGLWALGQMTDWGEAPRIVSVRR